MNKTLVSWIGNNEIETFSPNCSMINRVLSFLNIDFDTKTISIETEAESLNFKISNLPILINGDEKIVGCHKIVKHLKELRSDSTLFNIPNELKVTDGILKEWCMSGLRASVIYFAYKEKSGFCAMKSKFSKIIDSTKPELEEKAMNIRSALIDSIKPYEISSMTSEEALEHLSSQLTYIDSTLGSKPFIHGAEMKLIDIMLYSHLNRILLRGMAPAELVMQKHYRLTKWLLRVASNTKSRYNIYPTHLEG